MDNRHVVDMDAMDKWGNMGSIEVKRGMLKQAS
jgi:hypothetical protein